MVAWTAPLHIIHHSFIHSSFCLLEVSGNKLNNRANKENDAELHLASIASSSHTDLYPVKKGSLYTGPAPLSQTDAVSGPHPSSTTALWQTRVETSPPCYSKETGCRVRSLLHHLLSWWKPAKMGTNATLLHWAVKSKGPYYLLGCTVRFASEFRIYWLPCEHTFWENETLEVLPANQQ